MLLGEPSRNPNYSHSIKARRIREKLPEMSVIGTLELVLYQHPAVRVEVFAKNVRPKWADGSFLGFNFEVHPKGLTQLSNVLWSCMPRREVRCITDPNIAEVNGREKSEWLYSHRAPKITATMTV